MRGIKLLIVSAIGLMFCVPQLASAQFFIGGPTGSYATTSGTVTNTPTSTANNLLREVQFSGQLDITNATPAVQTGSFTFSCQLDPTFNGGTPLSMQLQVDQSGFTNVPAGGLIYSWQFAVSLVDITGVDMGGSMLANDPSGPYGPGITTYGPTTTLGPTFTYNPAIASEMLIYFVSPFDGLVPANTYTWDFPITIRAVEVPEPATIGILIGCCPMLFARRRPR